MAEHLQASEYASSIPEGVLYRSGHAELMLPAGTVSIDRFLGEDSIPPHIESNGEDKILVCIARGTGSARRLLTRNEFSLQGGPAVFYLPRSDALTLHGEFGGWVVRFIQANPQDLEDRLPTVDAYKESPVMERIYTREEIEEARKKNGGYFANWGGGQWNSQSPINFAYAEGGLGSTPDEPHREPDGEEIVLVNEGRMVHTEMKDDGKRPYQYPVQAGDIAVVSSDVWTRRTRLSHLSAFVLKVATQPGTLINPKAKQLLREVHSDRMGLFERT